MAEPPPPSANVPGQIEGGPSLALSSNNTSLSFERTRMSADRTLMSVIRTALSLISFGFTIFSFFGKLAERLGTEIVARHAARNFGVALVALGVGMLIAGLFAHVGVMQSLRRRRDDLHEAKLLRRAAQYQTSPTAVIAVLLLLVGLTAVLGMVLRAGPFGG